MNRVALETLFVEPAPLLLLAPLKVATSEAALPFSHLVLPAQFGACFKILWNFI